MNAFIILWAAAFGAAIGSFLNVCIFRLPRACLRIWKPKMSFCPKCRRTLPWYENVPILGYLFLLGKCRGCRAPIPLRYFLVEVGNALLWAYVAQRWLIEPYEAPHYLPRLWGPALAFAFFGSALIVCALIDWDHRIIPDEIDVPGFLLAPLIAFAAPEIFGWQAQHAPDLVGWARWLERSLFMSLSWWGVPGGASSLVLKPLHAIGSLHGEWVPHVRAAFGSLLGVATGGGAIWAIGWLGDKAFRPPLEDDEPESPAREGDAAEQDAELDEDFAAMGFGDVKFMAMLGGFTGWLGVPATVVVAAVLGSVFGIFEKVRTGRTTVTGKDLRLATPLGYRALRLWGAPDDAPDDQVIALRAGGSFAARLATGDPHIAFGPFLAIGAAVYVYRPELLVAVHSSFSLLVPH